MRWGISLLRGPGRAAALGVVAVALLLRGLDVGIVAEPRLRVFDLEERLWPRAVDPARVTIVDIDEESLAQYGQWPWPRTLVAQLVRRIADGHPRVLGIDVVFAEQDRLSPSGDHELAEAIRTVPTVLAVIPGREEVSATSDPLHPTAIRQAGSDPTAFLMNYRSLLRSLPDLGAATQGAGSIAVEPDADGIVRRVALAVSHHGTVIPGFALEVLRVGGAERSTVIDTSAQGIKSIRVGGLKIPTDSRGRAIPHFSSQLPRYISAADVLDPGFDPAELRSQIVLLGVAGLGIADLPQTPLGPIEGVEVHAQLIESMLLETLLRRPPYLDWIELGVALMAGFATIWLLRYDRPVRAAAIALAIAAGLIGFELASFRFAGLLFDGTYPAATLLATFGVMLVGNLRATEAALGREREATQRFEGELAAAQAIQMGLLPRRFPAFPDRPEIDVYARIEPARIVGGDLYDYLLIDRDRRLFFLIADVSGKGAPAALLMATAKEIIREAVLKFGSALDSVLAEANRKTATASADLQSEGGVFVTAFAGILELGTGDVAYASAGHESPFVLGGDKGLRQLKTEGGPPLGAADEFSYPIDRDRIEPGEVLLLYTDGVSEAENGDQALYGARRLAEALSKAPTTDAKTLVDTVVDDVHRFVGDAEQVDDITLVALRRVGGVAARPKPPT